MEEPMAFRPYLFFGGNCRQAFTRYKEIFGGELTLLTMKDVPGEPPPADQADMIIHAALTLGGDDFLMASDDPTTPSFGPVQGMMISYDAADVGDAKRVFDALSEGGSVDQALEPTFFSEAFGMCTDQFGTPWMVVGPQPQPTS
jgi:PhnB protein